MMKKLLSLLIVASSVFFAKATEPIDVTDAYLDNCRAPFEATGEELVENGELIDGQPRWQILAAPWVTEGDVINSVTNVRTTWHVDFEKYQNYPTVDQSRKGVFTLTPGWDGFADTFQNLKAYQTVTLPAGNYEFIARRAQDWTGADNAYLVAAIGTTLPNIADFPSALGYTKFNTAIAPNWDVIVNFKLSEESVVTLGTVASYTNAKQCVTISDFILNTFEGANFRIFDALLIKAQGLTSTQYPVGTILGTYSQEKWNALQAAIAAAENFKANGDDDTDQAEIDAQVVTLQNAIDELDASMVLPFKISTEDNEHWYQVRDQRATPNYWQIGEYSYTDEDEDVEISYDMALVLSQYEDSNMPEQLFKFEKAPAPAKGYYIYSQLVPEMPLTAYRKGNIVLLTDTLEATPWLLGTTKSAVNFTVFLEGKKTDQLNSYASYEPPYVGFYYPGDGVNDFGNNWEFIEVLESGQTDFTELTSIVATALRMSSDTYPVGNAENQFPQNTWDAFVAARTQALAVLDRQNDEEQPSQDDVDLMVETLRAAIAELNDSQNPGFFVSDETTTHWYTLSDKRATPSYWVVAEVNEDADETNNQLVMIKGKPAAITDSLIFKVVKAEEPYEGYYIYSKANEEIALTGLPDDNWIGFDQDQYPTSWLIEKTSNPGFYLISTEETGDQINSYAGHTPPYIAFYAGGEGDPGNNWKFNPAVLTSVKTVKAADFKVYVVNRMILTNDTELRLTVYNINGQKVDARRQLTQGVYIVRAEGKTSSIKVIVR